MSLVIVVCHLSKWYPNRRVANESSLRNGVRHLVIESLCSRGPLEESPYETYFAIVWAAVGTLRPMNPRPTNPQRKTNQSGLIKKVWIFLYPKVVLPSKL